MGRIRIFLVANLLLSARYHALAGEAAELVWPEDRRAQLAEVQAGPGTFPYPASWPVTAGELCGQAKSPLLEACREPEGRPLRAHLALGGYGMRPSRRAGARFGSFDGNSGSSRIDPEFARAWSGLSPVLALELRHAFSPRVFTRFRLGLRRDLSAWREDDWALNLPASEREIDLDEPSFGYLHYAGDWAEATIGRFPLHWGPSPDFGLALSSAVPFHNAVQAVLKGPRLRYRFLVSSLNPWLEGAPPAGPGTEYPVGSEEWRQRNYPVLPGSENAHKRAYAARVKTLIAHRLEARAGPLAFGITETQIIGGKVPDLRDANPFAVFHNDFHEGYSNNNVSLDAGARLPSGFSLAAEIFMDDLEWSETEGEGASPSLLGYLAGLRHAFSAARWTVTQSLHAIRTDPFLYGFLQPLNTYASRNILADGDPTAADRYVADHPIGYLRGGDAFDVWYRASADRSGSLRLAGEAAWLSRGDSGPATPFEEYYAPHGSSPSGTAERELRLSLDAAWRPIPGLELGAGLGWSFLWNAGNIEGRQEDSPMFSTRIGWTPW